MMLRLLLLWGWLLAAGASRAQAPATEIDRLTTAAQVQQFVRTCEGGYKEFVLTDSISEECDMVQRCALLGTRSSWTKADFDGNGKADLLVLGYRSSTSPRRMIMCFLDLESQKLQKAWLVFGGYNCDVPQLCQVRGQVAIRYAHIVMEGERSASTEKAVCQVDTLIFDKTNFIEYNRSPKNYDIQKIVFSTTECYGICPVFDLQISREGTATYQAKKFSKKEGNFTTTIKPQQFKELWRLLNYLDLPKLRDHYAVPQTDNPTCTLTITYGNGQVKTIEDYGEKGTFGLQRVYRLLFALRESQAWH